MIYSPEDIDQYKIALARVIAPLAFWSYQPIESDQKISEEMLIEAVLIHGNDPLRRRLFKIFKPNEIKKVWKNRLIIQGPRLDFLNKKIAKDFFNLDEPEKYIKREYDKNNLYERFGA